MGSISDLSQFHHVQAVRRAHSQSSPPRPVLLPSQLKIQARCLFTDKFSKLGLTDQFTPRSERLALALLASTRTTSPGVEFIQNLRYSLPGLE